jgi:radical SAM protein with 4Fe4S-binding SPASM domain
LRNAGIAITLKAMAMRATKDELFQIRDYARDQGWPFRWDAVLSPRIDGGRKPLEQRLTPLEVADIETEGSQAQSSMAEYCQDRVGDQPADDRRYQCGAGLSSFVIDPYGKMHVCNLSRRPGWDVLRQGFKPGFEIAFAALRDERREVMHGCGTCPTSGVCSNCVGMSELEARSKDMGDPYFCQVSDARAAIAVGANHPTPNGLVRLRLRGEHG